MSIESVMPSNHLIVCHPLLLLPQSFPASGSFPMSQLFASGGQSVGVSASASDLLMNIQDWSPLGWTGLVPLQFRGLSRVFSNITVQKHQFFGAQLSFYFNSPIHTWLLEKNHSFDKMNLCWQSNFSAFNMLFRLVIAFLPRSKRLLTSWLQSPSAVILKPKKIKSLLFPLFSHLFVMK